MQKWIAEQWSIAMLKYNPIEVSSMSAKLLFRTGYANKGLLKFSYKSSLCLKRGIGFIDKRAENKVCHDF